ncbi:1-phosphatidylinositol 4,5-bisphosphate phosphodiesterase beta-2-like isoform X2 [Scyliorhinus canicula]|uniref:1-phosphatidylinositol 4,5-bisphosphate phosphodiesterase beta-2-like isoform X2 n=1 Tax=Scyliorhinus canicula TaxID=7830 RepID=UPI0018F2E13D|nr:1-phosphatidylinositol 4,5-bisphosphate phosphodiesterase beta-2-like isoform X2 [Scyliorhinus canicula]
MAGTASFLAEIVVKPPLVHGEKFIKWDDDTGVGSPVVLRIDSYGHFLYWTYQNKHVECLEITTIRDTRIGKYAKVPKNPKIREIFNVENPESNFYTKCLTVVSGSDFVNLTFDNFVAFKEKVVKGWADEILTIATHALSQNPPRSASISKMFTKIKLFVNEERRIPVKNIYQMFPADRKRVEAALLDSHLPSLKTDLINPEDFTELAFKQFLSHLCPRPEINDIFELLDVMLKPYLTRQQMSTFINKTQRDARLNDFLFKPLQPEQIQNLILKYEPAKINSHKGHISPEGLMWYLSGPENNLLFPDRLTVYQDMTQPLPHYFINSSHNTYLTAGQFSGISSPEMYRQVLLAGCRCLELDCWKGRPPDEEPIITHGFTMTTEILFKDVIEAIAESAFKTSQYPVILSFENHVDSPKQQAKMADYCRTIFGDMLLTETLDKYPLKPGAPIPSPQELMGKILIKNKKNQMTNQNSQVGQRRKSIGQDQTEFIQTGENVEEQCEVEEESENVDQEEEEEQELKKNESDEGTAGQEVRAYEEMSSLVNYIQPVKFESFEVAKKKNKSYIISSFTETKALDLLVKFPIDLVEYNKRQMSRIYPKGTRVDSSNYMPHIFWNAGCQMVALNFQTADLPMQLNNSFFEFNGRSGYILKHELLVRLEKTFDPFTTDRIDVVVSNTVSILIISGQFLSDRNSRFYVEVELFGLHHDPKRKYRTKLNTEQNSINPQWKDEETFVFEKILVPELTSIRIATYDDSGKFIGHKILPVTALQTGYRHIGLRNETNQQLTMPSLFVHIEVKDYVPDTWADLTKALADPIEFVCTLNKQSAQVTSAADAQSVPEEKSQMLESGNGAMDITPNTPTCLGNEESSKDTTELEPLTIDELKTHKAFVKVQKKQEKELKELERKCQKKKDDVIQKYSSSFSELRKKNVSLSKGFRKKWSLGNIHESAICGESLTPPDSMSSNGAAAERGSELRDKMQADLQRVHTEQYKLIRDRKEQHITEQVAKLMEIAKEKQVAALKILKESAESEMKDVKKKIELKRQEKIETMLKNTADKSLQEKRKKEINEHHIQMSVKLFKLALANQSNALSKLDEQHTAKLEEIKEKEKEYQQEAQNEYEAKLDALPQVVVELSESIITTKFTLEPGRPQDQGKDVVESKTNELPPANGMMVNPSGSATDEAEDGVEVLIAEL